MKNKMMHGLVTAVMGLGVFLVPLSVNAEVKHYSGLKGKVYVCTLKPFMDVYADVGVTESFARYKVKQRCEQAQGEDSLFCKEKEAVCISTSLFGEEELEPTTPKQLMIYSQLNLRGKAVAITHDEPDLSDFQFNDALSSYSVPSGWIVRFYEGKHYTGAFYTRKGGKGNATDFDNTVSSIRVLTSY